MTLQSAIEAQLPFLRAEAEATMVDTYAAYSPGGAPVIVDGLEVPGYTSQGSTPGKTQGGSRSRTDVATEFVEVGGVRRPLMVGGLHIPISATIPAAGDRGIGWEYVCTAIGAQSDPSLLGRRYLVWSVPAKTNATARRLDVVEVPAP